MNPRVLRWLGAAALLLLPALAFAQEPSILDAGGSLGVPAISVTTNPDGSQDYTITIQILAIMTALTLLPWTSRSCSR